MCGRFTLRTPATVLIAHFDLDVGTGRQLPLFEPRYNIAPTQEIVVVRADPQSGRRTASMLRWGLIPSWAKDVASGPPQINARAETLAEKPTFRTAYRRRRCLVPADGFYEWQAPAGGGRGKKQPFYIHRRDHSPFAFAGLYETWTNPHSNQADALTIESCAIVTTASTGELKQLHDRMPLILSPSDYALWLDSKIGEPAALNHLLAPCEHADIVADPVSTRVNRVANDDPQCIAVQRALFD